MLYASARHFLLVDDVHELHGVVALHINHRPFQGILGHLVQLRRDRQINNIRDDIRFDLDIYVLQPVSIHANPPPWDVEASVQHRQEN